MAHTCWIWRFRLGRSTLAPMMGLFIQYLRVSWQNVGSGRLRHHNVSFEQNLRSWSFGMALQYIRPSEDPTHAQLWPGRGVERWHESKSNEKHWIKLKSKIITNPEMPWAQGHMLFWEWIVRLSEMTPASDDWWSPSIRHVPFLLQIFEWTEQLKKIPSGAVRQWQWHFLCIERTTGHSELAVRCRVSYLHFRLCAPRWAGMSRKRNETKKTRNRNLRKPHHVPELIRAPQFHIQVLCTLAARTARCTLSTS